MVSVLGTIKILQDTASVQYGIGQIGWHIGQGPLKQIEVPGCFGFCPSCSFIVLARHSVSLHV